MVCDIRYDSPMMTDLSFLRPLTWFLLALCMAVIALYRLAEHPRPGWWWLLQLAWWVALTAFISAAVLAVVIAVDLRSYGCDIAYVTAWTNPFRRLPQVLAVSGIGLVITGVASLAEKHTRARRQ